MAWPDARCRLLESTEICGGLWMVTTPGHTPGHMSVLVNPPGAAVLLAIDAINCTSEPAEGFPDAMDPATAARSAARLYALQRRHRATLIPGHEPE